MSDFQSYLTNGNFIGAYNANKEGDKNSFEKGIVYIEDDSDQVFWEKFIDAVFPHQYNVQASIIDRPSQRGKRALEKLYESANKKVLIAVDSDYDIICPSSNPQYSGFLLNNPFILHTCSYSKESVCIHKVHLNEFFKKIKHTIKHDINILSFLEKFSKVAFDGLVIFAYELNHGNEKLLIQDDFHKCFNILEQELINEDLTINEESILIIQNNLEHYFVDMNYPPDVMNQMQEYLINLGINVDNAYRFISGHTVYNLIFKVYSQLINKLKSMEIDRLKREFSGKELGNRVGQISDIFSKNFTLESCCNDYPINPDDEIHQEILNKIKRL